MTEAMKGRQRLTARQLREAIHDEVGPHLFFIATRLSVLKDELRGKQRKRAVEALKELEAARALAQRLGRGVIEKETLDLSGALRSLGDKMGWTFRDKLKQPLRDPEKAVALFQIAREAAHNAARHGRATKILIELSPGLLKVQDNGSGFSKRSRPGAGLKLMRKRARRIGGTLTLQRVATGGTILACQFL